MKKLLILLFASLFLSFIIGCKNEGNTTETNDEITNDSIVYEDVEPQAAILNFAEVDENTPVPVSDLFNAVFAWNGREVTVIGYCDVMFSYGTVKDEVKLTEHPDSSKQLVYCELKEEYNGEKVEQSTPIVVKGIIDKQYFDGISLKDCEIVSVGGEIKPCKQLNPNSLPENPIFVADLHKAYFALYDKKVTVVGHYFSTTTSTTDYGTTVRIDLSDPKTNEIMVGCRMIEDPTESADLANNRDYVKIKGIIKGEAFGRVLLEECELVK
ncbi:MAG: hypothetical protein Kow0068_03530 [Marinilabiliales bacterium]